MPGDRADIIFTNGAVHTVDAANSLAEAVAVADGRILAVGSNTAVAATAGPATTRIDLRGRSLTPGFIDAHHHFALGADPNKINCKAAGMSSVRAIVEEVRKKAEALPAGAWIRGGGWDQSRLAEERAPNRMDLDAVSPNNPVVLVRTCGHILSFNTKAMEAAGLSLTAPDVDGGRYDRDADGRLIGVSYERANAPIQVAAAPTRAELRENMTAANRACLASGLTSVHDAGGLAGVPLDVATEMVAAGDLQVRLYGFVTVNSADHPLAGILATGVRSGFGDERLRMGAFKVITDGSSSGPTAATREPYASNSDDSGIAYWAQDGLDQLIGRAHRAGWQCTVHAVGDRAIEQTLNAMARAQSEYPRERLRHRIEHCAMLPPDLQRRVRLQGIVPIMQPAFLWEFGDGYIRNYGRERADLMFPARSMLDAGVIVAGSSDSPVTDFRPLFGIEQAQTRATMDGDVCGPNERLDLVAALRMHTINGAYASFEEHLKGSIEPGKLADLALLSADIRKVPVTELRDLPIDMTVVGGQVVSER